MVMWRYAWALFLWQCLYSFNKAIHYGVMFFFTHHISSSKNRWSLYHFHLYLYRNPFAVCDVYSLCCKVYCCISCSNTQTPVICLRVVFFWAFLWCSHYYSPLLDEVVPSCIVAFRSYVVTVCAVSTMWSFSLHHSVSSFMWDVGSFSMLVWTCIRNFCSYVIFGVVWKISAHTLILWKRSHRLLLNWEWHLLYHE